MIFDENIAVNLYNYCANMDAQNYSENKENEINLLNQAIEKVCSYACYNTDFLALYNALNMAFGEV